MLRYRSTDLLPGALPAINEAAWVGAVPSSGSSAPGPSTFQQPHQLGLSSPSPKPLTPTMPGFPDTSGNFFAPQTFHPATYPSTPPGIPDTSNASADVCPSNAPPFGSEFVQGSSAVPDATYSFISAPSGPPDAAILANFMSTSSDPFVLAADPPFYF